MFKKNQEILFYVKRYRCWLLGTIREEAKFDKELNCTVYSIKDETGSNWAVQDCLVTNKPKKGMKIMSLKIFKFYYV